MIINTTLQRLEKIKSKRFMSLEDLAKGRMFSPSMLKKVVNNANHRRSEHRLMGRQGWTKDKHMRSEVRIPTHFYLNPDFQKKYFPEADEHEKVKALERLKRDYPIFVTHD